MKDKRNVHIFASTEKDNTLSQTLMTT